MILSGAARKGAENDTAAEYVVGVEFLGCFSFILGCCLMFGAARPELRVGVGIPVSRIIRFDLHVALRERGFRLCKRTRVLR